MDFKIKISLEDKLLIEQNLSKINDINLLYNSYYISGKIKNGERFSEVINNTTTINLIDSDNDVIEFVISDSLIKSFLKEVNSNIHFYEFKIKEKIDYVYKKRSKGFLLIKKIDFPGRLLNSMYVD